MTWSMTFCSKPTLDQVRYNFDGQILKMSKDRAQAALLCDLLSTELCSSWNYIFSAVPLKLQPLVTYFFYTTLHCWVDLNSIAFIIDLQGIVDSFSISPFSSFAQLNSPTASPSLFRSSGGPWPPWQKYIMRLGVQTSLGMGNPLCMQQANNGYRAHSAVLQCFGDVPCAGKPLTSPERQHRLLGKARAKWVCGEKETEGLWQGTETFVPLKSSQPNYL